MKKAVFILVVFVIKQGRWLKNCRLSLRLVFESATLPKQNATQEKKLYKKQEGDVDTPLRAVPFKHITWENYRYRDSGKIRCDITIETASDMTSKP